ncbi:MAG: AAA family ATPase, partial [Actinobacteria bacterium]|nr:AAA family ATPase [Actinomycetota bacterium]
MPLPHGVGTDSSHFHHGLHPHSIGATTPAAAPAEPPTPPALISCCRPPPRSGDVVVPEPVSQEDLAWFGERFDAIASNIERVIQGKRDVIDLVVLSLLSEGHVLMEDVPGVGKTLLAKALARSIHCNFQRIQFTPDLLPSDVTGVSVWDRERNAFVFRAG